MTYLLRTSWSLNDPETLRVRREEGSTARLGAFHGARFRLCACKTESRVTASPSARMFLFNVPQGIFMRLHFKDPMQEAYGTHVRMVQSTLTKRRDIKNLSYPAASRSWCLGLRWSRTET